MSEPESDTLCAVQFPLSSWRILMAHLQAGPFPDVANSFSAAIYAQIAPQVEAALAAAQAKEVQAARELAEAADATQRRQATDPKPITTEKVIH